MNFQPLTKKPATFILRLILTRARERVTHGQSTWWKAVPWLNRTMPLRPLPQQKGRFQFKYSCCKHWSSTCNANNSVKGSLRNVSSLPENPSRWARTEEEPSLRLCSSAIRACRSAWRDNTTINKNLNWMLTFSDEKLRNLWWYVKERSQRFHHWWRILEVTNAYSPMDMFRDVMHNESAWS